MNQPTRLDTTAGPARPTRPDLFASPDKDSTASTQRISVLASLDARPAPAPRRSRRPLWIALACLSGICALSGGIWFMLASPAPDTSTAADAGRPRTLATAEPAQATQAPHPKPEESAAPASIERLATEQTEAATPPNTESPSAQSHPASEDTVVAVAVPAPAPHTASPANDQEPAARPEAHKSLLHTLAAPQKPAQNPPAGKTRPRAKESLDTDVILLEALVSHSKKTRAEAAPAGEVTP